MLSVENAHALVVGIANYCHINGLPPTVLKDAQDIHDLLIDAQICGYREHNVSLLKEEEATLAGLRRSLDALQARTNGESTVFIYLSCHGGRIESGDYAGEYLLPIDTKYDSDQSLANTAMPGAEFTQRLSALRASKVVVVFDCCHAAGLGRPKGFGMPKNGDGAVLKVGLTDSYYLSALKSGVGRVILAACLAEEESWILENAANSLFTHHLLAGLRGGIVSDNGCITITQLFTYVFPRVTAAMSKQHPLFRAELQDDFPIALYLGGAKGGPPPDPDGFRYDAYIVYADQEPDSDWVWDNLVPRLEASGLKVAVSGVTEDPGVPRLDSIQRILKEAKRTIVVMSPTYLADRQANFTEALVQGLGVQEGAYRLLPIKIAPFDSTQARLSTTILVTPDFTHPTRVEREFGRLIQALQAPLPRF